MSEQMPEVLQADQAPLSEASPPPEPAQPLDPRLGSRLNKKLRVKEPRSTNAVTHKVCNKCKQNLPAEAFCRQSNTSDGLNLWCKRCRSDRIKQWKKDTWQKNAAARKEPDPEKQCARCLQTLPAALFFRDYSHRTGLEHFCKACKKAIKTERLRVQREATLLGLPVPRKRKSQAEQVFPEPVPLPPVEETMEPACKLTSRKPTPKKPSTGPKRTYKKRKQAVMIQPGADDSAGLYANLPNLGIDAQPMGLDPSAMPPEVLQAYLQSMQGGAGPSSSQEPSSMQPNVQVPEGLPGGPSYQALAAWATHGQDPQQASAGTVSSAPPQAPAQLGEGQQWGLPVDFMTQQGAGQMGLTQPVQTAPQWGAASSGDQHAAGQEAPALQWPHGAPGDQQLLEQAAASNAEGTDGGPGQQLQLLAQLQQLPQGHAGISTDSMGDGALPQGALSQGLSIDQLDMASLPQLWAQPPGPTSAGIPNQQQEQGMGSEASIPLGQPTLGIPFRGPLLGLSREQQALPAAPAAALEAGQAADAAAATAAAPARGRGLPFDPLHGQPRRPQFASASGAPEGAAAQAAAQEAAQAPSVGHTPTQHEAQQQGMQPAAVKAEPAQVPALPTPSEPAGSDVSTALAPSSAMLPATVGHSAPQSGPDHSAPQPASATSHEAGALAGTATASQPAAGPPSGVPGPAEFGADEQTASHPMQPVAGQPAALRPTADHPGVISTEAGPQQHSDPITTQSMNQAVLEPTPAVPSALGHTSAQSNSQPGAQPGQTPAASSLPASSAEALDGMLQQQIVDQAAPLQSSAGLHSTAVSTEPPDAPATSGLDMGSQAPRAPAGKDAESAAGMSALQSQSERPAPSTSLKTSINPFTGQPYTYRPSK